MRKGLVMSLGSILKKRRIGVLLLVSGYALVSVGFSPNSTISTERDDLVFTTDDDSSHQPGCDAISVFNSTTGAVVERGRQFESPGRLAVNSTGKLVLSVSNNSGLFLSVLRRDTGGSSAWISRRVGAQVLLGAPIGITPDDRYVLVPLRGSSLVKHASSTIDAPSLGEGLGRYGPIRPADIVFGMDPATAYVVDTSARLHVIDVRSMAARGDPIPFQAPAAPPSRRLRNTFAAVSPDGRYVVVNSLQQRVVVVDLVAGRSHALDTPGIVSTHGLAFNYSIRETSVLAVHGHSKVAVYEFRGFEPLQPLCAVVVAPQPAHPLWEELDWDRVATLAWTGRGDGLIAAIGGEREYRVFAFEADVPCRLRPRTDLDTCKNPRLPSSTQFDVVTLNRPHRLPTPTASPSPQPSPTSSQTPTPTPSPTAPISTPSPSPTPSPTRVPLPIYLPFALKEECVPGQEHADVVLVMDASTSMLGLTRDGRTKLAAASEAALLFVQQLSLPTDQAAVIEFNEDGRVIQRLTGREDLVREALSGLQVRRQTRIDLGIELAHDELMGDLHKLGNRRVMIVLTDGRANPLGADVAVAKAAAAKDDDILVFTIGLGEDLDLWALEQIASKSSYFYRAPDAEDLRSIYQTIAAEIPCPAESFWGRR